MSGFGSILSDKESDDSDEEGEYTQAFVTILSRDDWQAKLSFM